VNTASIGSPGSFHRRARWGRLLGGAAAVALAAMLAASGARAADPTPDEIEARFVFQLLNYVTWPESALAEGAPLRVGVLGDEGFATTLRRVVGDRRAQDRAVEVRSVAEGADPGAPHLLFVREADPTKLRELARQHHGTPVLLVAERFDFPRLGGDVGLELVGGRVSFSINRRKSERGDLVISSKLMRLASEVK
jgi:uncharacterized protein DUF4154